MPDHDDDTYSSDGFDDDSHYESSASALVQQIGRGASPPQTKGPSLSAAAPGPQSGEGVLPRQTEDSPAGSRGSEAPSVAIPEHRSDRGASSPWADDFLPPIYGSVLPSGPDPDHQSDREAAWLQTSCFPPGSPGLAALPASAPEPRRDEARSPLQARTFPEQPRITRQLSDEHQLYQRLRLRLVQLFGSLAAALYELGADPDTGALTRSRFAEVTCGQLGILTTSEADLLFSHVASWDILECGLGNVVTFKDFSIPDEEWRHVVSAKSATSGQSVGPFQFGPSGSSLGVYHRPIHITTANEDHRSPSWPVRGSPTNSRSGEKHGGGSQTLRGSPKNATNGEKHRGASPTAQRSPRSCRNNGRLWSGPPGTNSGIASVNAADPEASQTTRVSPRINSLGGAGLPSAAAASDRDVGLDAAARRDLSAQYRARRARGAQEARAARAARMAKVGERLMSHPKQSQLGSSRRGWCIREGDNARFLASSCPTRRCEMAPSHCAGHVGDIWPYAGPQPTPQLRATRARLIALSARG